MKSYELDLVEDLKNKRITITSKRIAYLVPNMFNRVSNGFNKKKVIVQESVVPANNKFNIPVQVTPNVPEEPKNDVSVSRSTIAEKAPVIAKVESKSYEIKVLNSDSIFLNTTKFQIKGAPRKLLISAMFIQKLILHRQNLVKKNVDEGVGLSRSDVAVSEYVDLMNKRKEAINTKQECEKKMTELVSQFGITLEMVNAELDKRKVA